VGGYPADRVSGGHIPKEERSVSARGDELGIVVRPKKRKIALTRSRTRPLMDRKRDLHRDREDLITVGRIGLDLCAQTGVPETDDPVLTTGKDIFRSSLGVPCDMHGAFVIFEGVV
jgi:hypothetical protein